MTRKNRRGFWGATATEKRGEDLRLLQQQKKERELVRCYSEKERGGDFGMLQ